MNRQNPPNRPKPSTQSACIIWFHLFSYVDQLDFIYKIEKIKKMYWILTVSLQLLRCSRCCMMIFFFFFLKILIMDFRYWGAHGTRWNLQHSHSTSEKRMSSRRLTPALSLQKTTPDCYWLFNCSYHEKKKNIKAVRLFPKHLTLFTYLRLNAGSASFKSLFLAVSPTVWMTDSLIH